MLSFGVPPHFLHFPGHRTGYADYREMNTSSPQSVSLFSLERNGEMLLTFYLNFRIYYKDDIIKMKFSLACVFLP